MPHALRVERIYAPCSSEDGRRILVDRLWPRGISKSKARLDAWLKDLAPSAELRVWFNHEPARWIEFRQRYLVELAAAPPGLAELRAAAAAGPVTLLHAARDEAHNNARVLADYLVGGT